MKLAMFGTTGYIGHQALLAALKGGHTVKTLVRNESKLTDLLKDQAGAAGQIEITTGGIADQAAIQKTVAGSDAVIWAIGATRKPGDEPELYVRGIQTVLAQMKQEKIKRIIVLAGAALILPGEQPAFKRKVMEFMLGLMLKNILRTNQAVSKVLQDNIDIDWTILRPSMVAKGQGTGNVKSGAEAMVGNKIYVEDLGKFFIDQLEDRTYIHKAPFMASF